MRVQPRWWVGVLAFLAYIALGLGTWVAFDIDYKTVAEPANLLRGVVLPLGVAAAGFALFNTWAGWWRPTLFEHQRLRRPVLFAVLLACMLGFIAITLAHVHWEALTPSHVLLLVAAMSLVGFCEEMLARGVLLTALRGSMHSEVRVWFLSTLLFGFMHASNAFFGVGALALVQVVLAFCAGTGLYLLRRFTGTLLVPIVVHAAWDFSTMSLGSSHGETKMVQVACMALVYVLSLVFAFLVLRTPRRA